MNYDNLRTAGVIQGYQRVGDASKGTNLSGNLHAELIIICTEKPTKDLLQKIIDMLPPILADVTKFSYQVTHQPDNAGFQVVYTEDEINVCVTVTLTSLDMREQIQEDEAKADESKGVLDRSSCQRALYQMRRTKWFQGQAINLPSYILIIRVLKDIARRVPAWTCMDSWMLELLLQKVLSVSPAEYTRPGDTIRSVVACIASGFFLPGSPGLMDPCEKDKVDASSQLTPQMREDLTFSAQHALRLISFKQLHKVLGLENAPKMQDLQESVSHHRMPMRRFSLYRSWRPKRKSSSTPDSEKKQKVEDTPAET
ncbi:Zinc finger RNA-binding protein-like [Oopsacas minuta]|uniref:Zinc finger RNA-binding protein-like n=1 Tax=Oopsacas minuta TaxID=111878 RepID=A0AAV7JAS8_9METZ|nr:Zinc finger RNA-binding protein-like [Oopsacas minuta]